MAERNSERRNQLEKARQQSLTFLDIVDTDQQAVSALEWQAHLDREMFAVNAEERRTRGERPGEPGKILPFPGVELPEGEDTEES